MEWVSYTHDAGDGYGRADSDYIQRFMSSFGHSKELKSVNSIMVEFSDSSFIRFERESK